MFAVVGYQNSNEDLINCFKSIRNHLKKGSVLIFDCWYGPAVLSEKPGERIVVIEEGNHKTIRSSKGFLETAENICNVHFHLWHLEDGKLMGETREEHKMRYFFLPEIQLILNLTGFDLVHSSVFPTMDVPPDETTWNIVVAAKAI